MANRLLLQTLLKFSDQIKSGAAKVQDVVTDYFNTTGKSVTDEERSIILKEFQDNAPDNITPLKGEGEGILSEYKAVGDDLTDADQDAMMDNFLQGADQVYANFVNKALVDLQSASKSEQQQMIKAIIGRKGMFKYLDDADAKKLLNSVDNTTAETGEIVGLKGDETFDELIQTKESDQGLGSLYPRGEPGEIFDIQNDKRREVAEFMKAMRAAGIKNEDVMNTAKITDVAEGKRAATTLARAAEMGADTKIKQELLGTLDEDIATNSPRFFQEEYMGYDSMGNLLENISTTVNNGIYDDLLDQGVPEDKVAEIFKYISRIRDNVKYDPKALLRKIADDVEMEDIKYDTTFWDNYIDEILTRIQKPAPRFADGGLV